MNRTVVLFEQALSTALEKVQRYRGIAKELTLVRDLRGRLRVLVPGSKADYKGNRKEQLDTLCRDLSESLGNYGFPPERTALFSADLALADSPALARDRLSIYEEAEFKVFLLDRQITGQDWLKETFERTTPNPRVTFFAIKGGVGRSTALVIWAWRLAKQGKKVLIFDLDLESPGVSSTLLPTESLPDFGIADWFVEDGVGQAAAVETEMFASSPLAPAFPGEIEIVPAFGRKTADYLPKLARCYAHSPGEEQGSWGDRLERMVTVFEESNKPDIVILDSRSGIHDIAAVAVTRMEAQSFLFSVESSQTWNAYAFLFRHWKRHRRLEEFRERLQIVSAMIPETGREEHLKRFREHSWDLFREHLYDEAGPEALDSFSFDLNDEGPHYPLPFFWHRALQEFDPLRSGIGMEDKIAEEAMGACMTMMDRMVFQDREGE